MDEWMGRWEKEMTHRLEQVEGPMNDTRTLSPVGKTGMQILSGYHEKYLEIIEHKQLVTASRFCL